MKRGAIALSNDPEGWSREMFADVGREGVPGLIPDLHEDVEFRFGSFPAGHGREAFDATWKDQEIPDICGYFRCIRCQRSRNADARVPTVDITADHIANE